MIPISAAVALTSGVSIGSSAVCAQVKMPRVPSPVITPTRHRLGQPSMQMGGGWTDEDRPQSLWDRALHRANQQSGRAGGPPRFTAVDRPRPPAPQPQSTFVPEPPATVRGLEAVWVMIFNMGQPNEGVYIQETSVLAFECTDDANHYTQLLLEKGFDLAVPIRWSANQLTTFCQSAGFQISVVPRGTLPMPPSNHYEPMDDFNQPRGHQGESMFESAQRRDAYNANKMWLEELFYQPDGCDDDDCVLR